MKLRTRIKILIKCYDKANSNGSSQELLDEQLADIEYFKAKLQEEDPAEYDKLMEEIL